MHIFSCKMDSVKSKRVVPSIRDSPYKLSEKSQTFTFVEYTRHRTYNIVEYTRQK